MPPNNLIKRLDTLPLVLCLDVVLTFGSELLDEICDADRLRETHIVLKHLSELYLHLSVVAAVLCDSVLDQHEYTVVIPVARRPLVLAQLIWDKHFQAHLEVHEEELFSQLVAH